MIKVIKLEREKLTGMLIIPSRRSVHFLPDPLTRSHFYFFLPPPPLLKLKIKSVKGKLNKLLSGLLT